MAFYRYVIIDKTSKIRDKINFFQFSELIDPNNARFDYY